MNTALKRRKKRDARYWREQHQALSIRYNKLWNSVRNVVDYPHGDAAEIITALRKIVPSAFEIIEDKWVPQIWKSTFEKSVFVKTFRRTRRKKRTA